MKNKSTNSNILFGIVILALLLFALSIIVNHLSQTVSAQSSNMTNILPEIENQNESTIVNQSGIIAINLTGIINQTDNTIIGLRHVDPRFCEEHSDSPVCKPKTKPPVDNICIKRPSSCDPCRDPTGICPQPKSPKSEFEDDIKSNLPIMSNSLT